MTKYITNIVKVFVIAAFIEIIYYVMYIVYYVKSRMERDERKTKNESIVYLAHSYGVFFLENLEI